MAVKTISEFKSRLAGGGARPNLFEVDIPDVPFALNWNGDTNAQGNLNFLCKATGLPAQNIAAIDVPFRGRNFKVSGDRTIDNWSITVINDAALEEQWKNGVKVFYSLILILVLLIPILI